MAFLGLEWYCIPEQKLGQHAVWTERKERQSSWKSQSARIHLPVPNIPHIRTWKVDFHPFFNEQNCKQCFFEMQSPNSQQGLNVPRNCFPKTKLQYNLTRKHPIHTYCNNAGQRRRPLASPKSPEPAKVKFLSIPSWRTNLHILQHTEIETMFHHRPHISPNMGQRGEHPCIRDESTDPSMCKNPEVAHMHVPSCKPDQVPKARAYTHRG